MDEERIAYLSCVIDRLVQLSSDERTAALTHLYKLRTAAVEDLSDLDDGHRHWDTVLGASINPSNITLLVRDLFELTDDELAIISMQITERSSIAHEQALQNAGDLDRAKLQAQLAASAKLARERYNAARQGLDMEHKAKLAEKMKDVRNQIEHGINTGQDVTTLEDIFDRIEQEFWEQYPSSLQEPQIKIEEE